MRYRSRYPNEDIDNRSMSLNLQFYRNEIKSVPEGDYIDDIHKNWFGKHPVFLYLDPPAPNAHSEQVQAPRTSRCCSELASTKCVRL